MCVLDHVFKHFQICELEYELNFMYVVYLLSIIAWYAAIMEAIC
jgi:hypothetical protein